MERTTLHTLLPGTPAVVGGLLALTGCAVSWFLIRSLDFKDLLNLSPNGQIGFCAMWVLIGIVAVAQEILWTRHAAKKQGVSPMARPARFAALSLSPSLIVAVVLSLKFLLEHEPRYIVPAWIMCYGTGLYAAGLFSVRLPRLLGLAFIVTGAVGLLWFAEYGVVLAALSFGFLHLAFGTAILLKTRREPAV
jgi:hypothetical protein